MTDPAAPAHLRHDLRAPPAARSSPADSPASSGTWFDGDRVFVEHPQLLDLLVTIQRAVSR